jgi:hypothetical protein
VTPVSWEVLENLDGMETKRGSDEASALIRSGAFSWGIQTVGVFHPVENLANG